jgi:DNA-directed RNA polymerase subunit RPC12/RpoP
MTVYRCARCGRDLRLIVHKVDDETSERYCLDCHVVVDKARARDDRYRGRRGAG